MSFIQLEQLTKQFHRSNQPAVDALDLSIHKGEIITLLGPSGCGKTTTLRMLAGFEKPSSGVIKIGDQVLHDQTHSTPPEKRGIGMVFQDYALFPHLTIEKNVMFGLNRWRIRERKKRAKEVLELVGLYDYKDRYPNALSGGQQQRIALARALAPKPHVVLLDEPFSNLDAGLREKMRHDIAYILKEANATAVIVSHDQKDAFAVSDRVVVMNEGVIQQIATPRDMYRCPRNCFVAQFVGKTNLLSGTMESDKKHVTTHIGRVCLSEVTDHIEEQVSLSVRPEGCVITENGQGRYSGIVERVMYSGEYQELYVRLSEQEHSQPMVIYAPVEQDIVIDQELSFNIKPELVSLVEH
ncbi:iron(III) transport system ATP-binding protein [Pelagirhabdus alkalitolerans]|uniref:Carnitine transport ATP-binding protein OpuCA n=1 Tax=Pelagirhabdus alkalitolerans TaxID=1612202 RepID=A0A1G6MN69_9BACI|nr:ABC transporter ATP-binding protein [Pelagirhabdus alkalitolerans]SDC56415.1 iron(III) transport system ATP-binding protein [Pelagirhabdus alkalitolerans]